jgi:hypothetical protein
LKKGQAVPFEKVSLCGSHFSCKRDRQPVFKFDMDPEVLFIYRLTPRKLDFLGWLAVFDTTPVSRFFGDLLWCLPPHTT